QQHLDRKRQRVDVPDAGLRKRIQPVDLQIPRLAVQNRFRAEKIESFGHGDEIESRILCAIGGLGRARKKTRHKRDGSKRFRWNNRDYFASFFAFGIGTSIFSAGPVSGVTTTFCPAFRSASFAVLPSIVTTVL